MLQHASEIVTWCAAEQSSCAVSVRTEEQVGDCECTRAYGGRCAGGSVPPIAQEPPAMRAQVTEAPGKAPLRSMISALEQLLVSMPESLESLPQELTDSMQGSYVQDWRTLTAAIRHGADGVLPPSLSLVLLTLHAAYPSIRSTDGCWDTK